MIQDYLISPSNGAIWTSKPLIGLSVKLPQKYARKKQRPKNCRPRFSYQQTHLRRRSALIGYFCRRESQNAVGACARYLDRVDSDTLNAVGDDARS